MKVYLVDFINETQHAVVVRVFSTQEKAEEFINQQPDKANYGWYEEEVD